MTRTHFTAADHRALSRRGHLHAPHIAGKGTVILPVALFVSTAVTLLFITAARYGPWASCLVGTAALTALAACQIVHRDPARHAAGRSLRRSRLLARARASHDTD